MTFEQALPVILRHEGGYVDHPDDPGGATNRGVTQATYDEWRRARGLEVRPVQGITTHEVEAIYRERYWLPAQCEHLPAAIRLAHFDMAVNCGVRNAARALQRALGVADDGVIGPVTLDAVHAADPRMLLRDMLLWRAFYYMDITARNRRLATFLRGWRIRLSGLRAEVVR